ncbi:MAG: LPS export ABC transporter permease LptG [Rhodospirillales bacterium]|nr:LPS export ABC transporter permease LptG [Rhodospirillales bacterium]MCB9996138.1 LPS export ABC transporter permease LptG [Rhodospirillales bacterium]
MIVFSTLNRYIAKNYLVNMLLMLLVLFGIIYLFDTVELLRRAGKKDDVPLGLVLQMGLLKLPEVGQMLFPFAILFGAMFTFWQLTRRQELIVARAAGFSVWQFLTPVIGVALLVGVLNVTVVNPLGAALLSRFETLENQYLSERKNYVTLLKEGLWLRQIEEERESYVILHADRINLSAWELSDVMVLFFGDGDMFLRRIDAEKARLADGMWQFEQAVSNRPDQRQPEVLPLVALPTELTAEELEESFASPETLSFWALPGFIKTMENTGFDATPLKIHFHTLLAEPLLFIAMVLLAAAVSMRPPRFSGTMMLIATGVVTGFVIFFLSSFLQALGASHQIPVFLAAWSPAMISLLLGFAVMLSLEDG